MKLLLGTAAISIALLSFASSNDTRQTVSGKAVAVTAYQDTIPKKDTSKKDRKKDKKERRDTLSFYR